LALVAECLDAHPLTVRKRCRCACAIPLDNYRNAQQTCTLLRQVKSWFGSPCGARAPNGFWGSIAPRWLRYR